MNPKTRNPFKVSNATKRKDDTTPKNSSIGQNRTTYASLASPKAVKPFQSGAKPPKQSEIHNPEDLVTYYQSQALAESTKNVYLQGWNRYVVWATENSRTTSLPLSIEDVHLFLAS